MLNTIKNKKEKVKSRLLSGKKKIIFLVFSFIAIVVSGVAQNPDIKRTMHWYFGNGAGLDFTSGTPVPITNSAMTAEEGSASISDTCGNLLFYTDGDTVWNKNNQPMPNGTGLMGCWSSTQSSLIVPQPDNDSIYYIFLTDCVEDLAATGTRYSTVNMNKDGGLGAITNKNVLLYAPSTEKLAATYHSNGTDIWILSCNTYPSGVPPDTTYQYYAYLLKTTGVDPTPVVSSSVIHPHKWGDCYMRFSHQGNKVANTWHAGNCTYCDTLEILDFNNSTGMLSNSLTLVPDSGDQPYGVVFSVDDSKLYHTLMNDFNYPASLYKIFQYDLYSNDSATIAASKTLIQLSDTTTNPLVPFYLALQSGNDGKIYVAKSNSYPPYYPDSIDVITNPNAAGLACNYVVNGAAIGGGSQAGLPNFVDSYFRDLNYYSCNDTLPPVKVEKCGEVFIPNAFSPNEDNQNDTLFIRSHCIKDLSFQIYDRWGEKVFETTDTSKGWGGSYNGKGMSTGVFVYCLNATLTNGNQINRRGNILLIK